MDDWEIFDIQVALKIIRHISAGIYRTPGGIIKELINNSYDAGATEVHVHSGYPSFSTVRIRDNGNGMDEDDIEFSFKHVGASQKVLENNYPTRFGRKIVGMFGIGMLAAVHASPIITMRTHPAGKNYGIEAKLDLSPYFEYVNQIKTLEEFKFGTIQYRRIKRNAVDCGTEIILENIDKKSNFYSAISRKSRHKERYVDWPGDNSEKSNDSGSIVERFVKRLDDDGVKSIDDIDGREQFLWELGMICPVEYLNDGPVKSKYLNGKAKEIIQEIKQEISRLKFKVYFDGVQIRKPILLPTTKLRTWEIDSMDTISEEDVRVFPLSISAKAPAGTNGVEVSARGYVLHQPYRITPLQLMGLYPRVKYVGVGRYDNNFFRIIHGEQPILRAQLSGELYIEKGLDEALNLDREGFIEIDPGYQILRDKLRDIIQENDESVVKEAKKSYRGRQERRARIKTAEYMKEIERDVVKSVSRYIPEKKVEIKPEKEVLAHPETRKYPSVAIRNTPSKVEISISDLNIDDPRTIALIIRVDELLSGDSRYKDLREKFITIVTELFREARKSTL